MKNATQNILALLKERGYRITAARSSTIDALAASPSALTVAELAKQVAADEASVYRTVSVLQEERLIEEIAVRAERPRFALKHGHHHHAVCRGCGLIASVDCSGELQSPARVPGFALVDEHEVTFYGLCTSCT